MWGWASSLLPYLKSLATAVNIWNALAFVGTNLWGVINWLGGWSKSLVTWWGTLWHHWFSGGRWH